VREDSADPPASTEILHRETRPPLSHDLHPSRFSRGSYLASSCFSCPCDIYYDRARARSHPYRAPTGSPQCASVRGGSNGPRATGGPARARAKSRLPIRYHRRNTKKLQRRAALRYQSSVINLETNCRSPRATHRAERRARKRERERERESERRERGREGVEGVEAPWSTDGGTGGTADAGRKANNNNNYLIRVGPESTEFPAREP